MNFQLIDSTIYNSLMNCSSLLAVVLLVIFYKCVDLIGQKIRNNLGSDRICVDQTAYIKYLKKFDSTWSIILKKHEIITKLNISMSSKLCKH